MQQNNQPKMRFKAGSVSCSIWENTFEKDGRTQVMLKAELSRRYKDRDGQWQSSNSFSRTELPMAVHVLNQAFAYMIDQANTSGSDSDHSHGDGTVASGGGTFPGVEEERVPGPHRRL